MTITYLVKVEGLLIGKIGDHTLMAGKGVTGITDHYGFTGLLRACFLQGRAL